MTTRRGEQRGVGGVCSSYRPVCSAISGNEVDVSCSVVRRVALPDAFCAADGAFQTLLHVLAESGSFPAVIERELARYPPFIATTKVLMGAVRAGRGREDDGRCSRRRIMTVAVERRVRM